MKGLFIGFNTVDTQFLVEEFPEQNKKIKAKQFELFTGGPATNAAIAFSHLGGKTTLISSIGKHIFTEFIISELNKYSIEVIDIIQDRRCHPLFTSVITHEATGDRSVVSYQPEDRDNCDHSFDRLHISGFDIILTDGFYMDTTIKILKSINDKIPVVMDGGSWKQNHDQLLPLIDIAVCSADFHPPGTSTSTEVIEFLSDAGIENVIITQGNKPILVKENNQFYNIPVQQVKAVDTLAAGDVFHGAFCFSYAKEKNIKQAVIFAAKIATKSCTSYGTRKWMDD